MRKLLALSVVLLWQHPVSAVETPSPTASGAGSGSAAAASAAASIPTLRIERVLVRDKPWFERFTSSAADAGAEKK